MSKIMKKQASGFLDELLAKPDKMVAAKTRNKMLIAAKIDVALKSRGMSQKDFATMMGKSVSEISEWLSGDRNFTVDTLTEITERLGVDLLNTSLSNMYNISCGCLIYKPLTKQSIVVSKEPVMVSIPNEPSYTDGNGKLKAC